MTSCFERPTRPGGYRYCCALDTSGSDLLDYGQLGNEKFHTAKEIVDVKQT